MVALSLSGGTLHLRQCVLQATQVIKRITEWQNVLINDLVNERMIYDKLKKRHEKLTGTIICLCQRQ